MDDDALFITTEATYTEFNGQPFVPPLLVEAGDMIVVLGATSERSAQIAVYAVDGPLNESRELVRGQWLRVTRPML